MTPILLGHGQLLFMIQSIAIDTCSNLCYNIELYRSGTFSVVEIFVQKQEMKFRFFFFFGHDSFGCAYTHDMASHAHTLLLGAGSFTALMVARLIASARGLRGCLKDLYREMTGWVPVCNRLQGS